MRYSPDGNVFGSASSDGKVLIYDGKDGTVVSCLGGEKAHSMGVTSLCWGPTAEQLLTVSSDRTAKLWDVEANQCVTTFKLGDKIPGDMQVTSMHSVAWILCLAYLLIGFVYMGWRLYDQCKCEWQHQLLG